MSMSESKDAVRVGNRNCELEGGRGGTSDIEKLVFLTSILKNDCG